MAKIANNKFNEILHLEREKVKKGFEMSMIFGQRSAMMMAAFFEAGWFG